MSQGPMRNCPVQSTSTDAELKPLAYWQVVLERREKAVRSLLDSLAHLPREQQFAVLTSYMTLNALEDIARFNER